jgi:hypothetical protein
LLRARAADRLMKSRRARLVIALRTNTARQLRLVAGTGPWDLPEARLLLVDASLDNPIPERQPSSLR